jgi:hypothetical protein
MRAVALWLLVALLLTACAATPALASSVRRTHRGAQPVRLAGSLPTVAAGLRSGSFASDNSHVATSPLPQQPPAIGQNWGNPVADPAAVVVAPGGKARFTVLTAQMIRMQYAPDGNFADTDVQTYVVLNRLLPVPAFTQQVSGSVLVISTGKLLLGYDSSDSSSFNGRNLQVTVLKADAQGNPSVWTAAPGMDQQGNLLGTLRTLDQFT